MSQPQALQLKPRILYLVAKAAWEGTLAEKKDDICRLVYNEFKNDRVSMENVANQIRIAMGLDPLTGEETGPQDEEALMGLEHPEHPVVANPAACQGCAPHERQCADICPFNAIYHRPDGKVAIDYDKCTGSGQCLDACSFGALAEKSQFVPLINLLKQKDQPVYASVAPAFAGQFGPEVTEGQLKTALRKLGFANVVETALFADLVTIKEAFEFDRYVKEQHDFMITSCCCPVWIKLIENKFPDLLTRVSPSVSPMIASGRVIKQLHPQAKVVFIGPCIAKKAEFQLPELKGAIDFVLTFKELATIFAATGIMPQQQEPESFASASWGGRVYARSGGVSAAVAHTLDKLIPQRAVKLSPIRVDGIPDCQKALDSLRAGDVTANFIEGMACKGGCVGGPGRLITPEKGTAAVNRHGDAAAAETPVQNPAVYNLLARLGHDKLPPLAGETSPMAALLTRHMSRSSQAQPAHAAPQGRTTDA